MIRGEARAVILGRREGEPLCTPVTAWVLNKTLRSWASVVTKLLGTGETKYRASGMYFEFVNVPSPGDQASVPAYGRDPADGAAYYSGLSSSPDRDYLRVPLLASLPSSSDEDLYPDGNVLDFIAQSSGVEGVHGKPFGEAYNSLVVGGAVVSMVSRADASLDLLFSRFYFEPDQQQPKLDVGNVTVQWRITLQ